MTGYIYYEIVHEAHKKENEVIDLTITQQVGANCLICADIINKCMKFFAIKININRKN